MPEFNAHIIPGGYYHIFNRGNNKDKLFLVGDNYNYFLKKFREYILPIADVFCYSLLPHHFHFFLHIKDEPSLISYASQDSQTLISPEKLPDFILQQFGNFFNAYTKAFNKVYNRHGRLFEESFKRKEIRGVAQYKEVVHYIHTNPILHGYCKHTANWPHTSYQQLLQGDKIWLSGHEVMDWFGSKENFTQCHEQKVQKKFHY